MLIYAIIAIAVVSRLLPHEPNLAIVTAVAIFAGSVLSWKQAAGITFGIRFLSDLVIGFFAWKLMVAVYAAHLVGIVFGKWIGGTAAMQNRWFRIFISGFGASAVFFLVTNFALLYHEYAHTWAGIAEAYTNGLPFLRGTMLGDVGYTVALFLIYDFARAYNAYRNRKDATVIMNA